MRGQGLSVDVNWGALSEDERRRALLNDELVQVGVHARACVRPYPGRSSRSYFHQLAALVMAPFLTTVLSRYLLNTDNNPQVMPRVTEANEISKELRRGITFETKIMPVVTKARGMVSVVMVRSSLKFFTP